MSLYYHIHIVQLLLVTVLCLISTLVSKIIGLPEFSPLDPIINKSCNIERAGKKQAIGLLQIRCCLNIYNLNEICCKGQLYQVTCLYFR